MRSVAITATMIVTAAALAPSSSAQAPAIPHLSASHERPSPVTGRDARLYGHSGALRAVLVPATAEIPHGLVAADRSANGASIRWERMMASSGDRLLGEPVSSAGGSLLLGEPTTPAGMIAPATPGIWMLRAAQGANGPAAPELAVITQVPFASKEGTALNGYRIGRYATEGTGRTDIYAPPVGFIEVTRENQDFYISRHFQLKQFLTKNQANVWPKYLALDLRLIDKLELVLQELNAMGIRADRMHVMSGFRTPDYNGPGSGGRAALSRHMYGDAADVWVDNDANGYMDDLNGDGVVDITDAQVMLRAVERVEQKYPELIGGAGLYVATGAHGPFIHIDVRGTPARW